MIGSENSSRPSKTMGSRSARLLYRSLLREIRAKHPSNAAGTFWASMYSKETVHARMYFMPSLDQMHAGSSQMAVLLSILPSRASSVARKWYTGKIDSMELAEAETEFGFGARQLNLLTRAFFEHYRHETKPEIIEDALNEGFDALHLITCSTQKRKWAFRYSTDGTKNMEPHVPSAAFPYQNRHQTMEKYLRDVHDAGRRPSALPQVGRRGNLVW